MTETVIRKITPGRPEASKTMSLGEAVDDYKAVIDRNKRLTTRLTSMYAISSVMILALVCASALGFFALWMIPSVLILAASAFWSLRLIGMLKNKSNACVDGILYLKEKMEKESQNG